MSTETHPALSDGNAIQEAARCDVTATLLDKGYPSSNATVTTNNDTNGNESRRNRSFSYKDCVFLVIWCLGMVGCGWLFVWSVSVHVPPFTFKVISLEVASMTISNNPSSDIQKYVSANLNLRLSLTNTNQELLIEPLVVWIMYDDEFLSSRKMDGLYTSSGKHKSIQLDMGITASQQLSGMTVDSMATNLVMNQSLVFKIVIQGRYSILDSGARAKYDYGVAMTCEGVKVNFLRESNLTSGIMVNGPCSCKHIVA